MFRSEARTHNLWCTNPGSYACANKTWVVWLRMYYLTHLSPLKIDSEIVFKENGTLNVVFVKTRFISWATLTWLCSWERLSWPTFQNLVGHSKWPMGGLNSQPLVYTSWILHLRHEGTSCAVENAANGTCLIRLLKPDTETRPGCPHPNYSGVTCK